MTRILFGLLAVLAICTAPSHAQERPDPGKMVAAFEEGMALQKSAPLSDQACAVAAEYFTYALTTRAPEVVALADRYDFDLAQTLWQHYAIYGTSWSQQQKDAYDAALQSQSADIQAGGLEVIYRNLGTCFVEEDSRSLPGDPLPLVNNYMVGVGRLPQQAGAPVDGRIKTQRQYDSNVLPIPPADVIQSLSTQCRQAGGIPLSVKENTDPATKLGGDPFQKIYDLKGFQPG